MAEDLKYKWWLLAQTIIVFRKASPTSNSQRLKEQDPNPNPYKPYEPYKPYDALNPPSHATSFNGHFRPRSSS